MLPQMKSLNRERRTSNAQRCERVPAEGLEPTRPCGHWILSPARLPIPPRRLFTLKRDFAGQKRILCSFLFYPDWRDAQLCDNRSDRPGSSRNQPKRLTQDKPSGRESSEKIGNSSRPFISLCRCSGDIYRAVHFGDAAYAVFCNSTLRL